MALGTHELGKGGHKISFRATDNAEQVGALAIEILRLLKLPPEAKRTKRTHHEAHFIRLGIGRALYAYRLAFDTLPDSLKTLVEEGFMPARYLRDENNLPLKAWREGATMVVESPGEDHWRHSWKGLGTTRIKNQISDIKPTMGNSHISQGYFLKRPGSLSAFEKSDRALFFLLNSIPTPP